MSLNLRSSPNRVLYIGTVTDSLKGNIWEKIAKKLCEIGSYLSKSPDVLDVAKGSP